MHALAAQGLVEFLSQQVINAVQDEIHHFHRRVDDAQAFGHFREGIAEELVVQLDHDLLFAGGVVDAFGAQLHAVVELLQRGGLLFETLLVEHIQHGLHGLAHRVVTGEAVVCEQRIEHRLGDQMLGQHFDDFGIGDLVVEIVTQFGGKGIERIPRGNLGGIFEQGLDAIDVGAGDLGDIIGPVFPVMAITAFVHDLGVQGPLDLAHFEFELALHLDRIVRRLFADAVLVPRLVRLAGQPHRLALHVVGNGDDFHLAAVRTHQVQLVDHRIEAVIV